MNTKNFFKNIILLVFLIAHYHCTEITQEKNIGEISPDSDFSSGIDDGNDVSIVGDLSKQKSGKQKVYFDHIVLDFPRAEYAKYDVAWLTTPKALEFNATEGMRVDVYEDFFEKYRAYIKNQNVKGKKAYMYMYFVKDIRTGKLLGDFQIDNIDYFSGEATLRFVVATDMEGKGYGTKMMRIMLEKAFDEIGCYRVIGTVALDNIASKRIFEKFGFKKEGILRKYYIVKGGKRIDMILFSMLKEEWEEFKKNESSIIQYSPNN